MNSRSKITPRAQRAMSRRLKLTQQEQQKKKQEKSNQATLEKSGTVEEEKTVKENSQSPKGQQSNLHKNASIIKSSNVKNNQIVKSNSIEQELQESIQQDEIQYYTTEDTIGFDEQLDSSVHNDEEGSKKPYSNIDETPKDSKEKFSLKTKVYSSFNSTRDAEEMKQEVLSVKEEVDALEGITTAISKEMTVIENDKSQASAHDLRQVTPGRSIEQARETIIKMFGDDLNEETLQTIRAQSILTPIKLSKDLNRETDDINGEENNMNVEESSQRSSSGNESYTDSTSEEIIGGYASPSEINNEDHPLQDTDEELEDDTNSDETYESDEESERNSENSEEEIETEDDAEEEDSSNVEDEENQSNESRKDESDVSNNHQGGEEFEINEDNQTTAKPNAEETEEIDSLDDSVAAEIQQRVDEKKELEAKEKLKMEASKSQTQQQKLTNLGFIPTDESKTKNKPSSVAKARESTTGDDGNTTVVMGTNNTGTFYCMNC